jgi:hypothetical protein
MEGSSLQNDPLQAFERLDVILNNRRGDRIKAGGRFIQLYGVPEYPHLYLDELHEALANPAVQSGIGAGQLTAVARIAIRQMEGDNPALASAVLAQARSIAGVRDYDFNIGLAAQIVADNLHNPELRACFPDLAVSPAMIAALTDKLEEKSGFYLGHDFPAEALRVPDANAARRLLGAAQRSGVEEGLAYAAAACGRGLGWTPWAKLFILLLIMPELAEDRASEPEHQRSDFNDQPRQARQLARAEIVPDRAVRRLARLVLDLDQALATAGPDVREPFFARIADAVAGNAQLRQAAIEALIWRVSGNQRDLALHTATLLAQVEDEQFLRSLLEHPDRETGYRAEAILRILAGDEGKGELWPMPTRAGISEGLFSIGLARRLDDEPPRTWLGDRLLERMIEETVAAQEEEFASTYEDHCQEGENGLVGNLFGDLARSFVPLDRAMVATAKATGRQRTARIALRYRPVSQGEEGKAGVHIDDIPEPPKFAADFCIVVDPHLDGRPLGKRAVLLQAKRLWLREVEHPEKGFRSSYHLDPQQVRDLLRQTDSAFYLFAGPGHAGRGIPVIPTRLVSDLSFHQIASGAELDRDVVGSASRPLADWLTYEVLALRTGDPLQVLIDKAEGGPGRRLRNLGRFGTLELEIRVGEKMADDEPSGR